MENPELDWLDYLHAVQRRVGRDLTPSDVDVVFEFWYRGSTVRECANEIRGG